MSPLTMRCRPIPVPIAILAVFHANEMAGNWILRYNRPAAEWKRRRDIHRAKKWIACLVGIVATFAIEFGCAAGATSFDQALETLAPRHCGLAVIVDAEDTIQAVKALRKRASLVQILCLSAEQIPAVRAAILDHGCQGVSVRLCGGGSLPYIDNLVNLLVLPASSAVAETEVKRVLSPGGTCLKRGSTGWTSWNKPWPKDVDEWTHFLHDASNNAVGQDRVVDVPRGIQWVSGPRWTRHHDHISSISAMVSAGGRLFYVSDQSSSMSIHLPGNWALVAKDAYNGATLWSKPIADWVNPLWPLKSGPASIPRRLVASEGNVYATLGISAPISCLDAATGEQRFVLADTEKTQEMILQDGTLICQTSPIFPGLDTYEPDNERSPDEQRVVDRKWAWRPQTVSLRAFDIHNRSKLWQIDTPVTPLSLAATGDHAFFHDGKSIHAVDRRTGKQVWTSPEVPSRPSLAPYFGVNLIATEEIVLFSGGDRLMTALDARSGERLWQAKHQRSGYRSPEDLFVMGDQVLAGDIANIASSGTVAVRDLKTGELSRTLPADAKMHHFPHHRCHRSKATERFILSSRTGIEFFDPTTGSWFNNHWTRGACLVGVLPCNGLVYAPSHHCLCYAEAKLEGFNALAPRSAECSTEVARRLVVGPAYGRMNNLEVAQSAADSWPMHRHDAKRSGSNPAPIGVVEGTTWTTPVGGRLTSPVVAEGKMVVADMDRHAVHALDAKTGRRLWRFIAGGRVDSAPTLFRGRVIFGCADGWIYCLDLTDGSLAWRFHAAPCERQHVAFEQVESAWPVHGSILIKDNVIYAVAGRSRFTDGGMRLLRIDPSSGAKISERVLDERRASDGEPLQENFNEQFRRWKQSQAIKDGKRVALMTFNDVGLSDILTMDGDVVFMRGYPLRFRDGEQEARQNAKLRVPWGLVASDWSHRTGWRYGTSPHSRILVFNKAGEVFGFGFSSRYQTLLRPFEHYLYGKSLSPGGATALWPDQKVPMLVRAMILAGDKLIVAGPPDYKQYDEPAAYQRHGEGFFRRQMKQQADALAGRRGGILWLIETKSGARLSEVLLDSPPVFDGMASTSAGIYVSTMAGHVVFLESR